jgi:hypothetical protein
MASDEGRVIDAAVRFLRTNPELVAYAHGAAPGVGMTVQELLEDAVARIRSASEAIAQEEMAARTAG